MKTWKMMLDRLEKGIVPNQRMINHECSYLEAWIASIFQRPYEPLPHLVLVGAVPNTGLSTFHEALSLILPTSRVKGTLQSYCNEELEHLLVAVIEDDIDLIKDRRAYSKILDWTSNEEITLIRQYRESKRIRNKLHWVHCTNEISVVNAVNYPAIVTYLNKRPQPQIPKNELLESLRNEAPEFIGHMITFPLPEGTL